MTQYPPGHKYSLAGVYAFPNEKSRTALAYFSSFVHRWSAHTAIIQRSRQDRGSNSKEARNTEQGHGLVRTVVTKRVRNTKAGTTEKYTPFKYRASFPTMLFLPPGARHSSSSFFSATEVFPYAWAGRPEWRCILIATLGAADI